MTKSSWIQIDLSVNPSGIDPEGKCGPVGLFIAPHQMPKAVRGFLDAGRGVYVIELRYPDDEEFKRERQDDFVCVRLGKHSRRLLGLELSTSNPLSINSVQLRTPDVERIEEAVDLLIQQESSCKGRENYSLAKKAIESKRTLLATELFATA